jgi:glycosyltransferase involved in cell wall biosynthesis
VFILFVKSNMKVLHLVPSAFEYYDDIRSRVSGWLNHMPEFGVEVEVVTIYYGTTAQGMKKQAAAESPKSKFIGRVEHNLLPQFYQQAHTFVLPSKNEGMSNAALEALASGLPLVVSGTGGMQELVTEGMNGCFIDPENPEAFAATLVSLAENPEKLLSLGQESRRRAELRDWNQVATHFKDALEQSLRQ